MSKAKQFFITQVWDYRLSSAQPTNYRGMPKHLIPTNASKEQTQEFLNNWVACVYENGEKNEPVEIFDTGIEFIAGNADNWNAGHEACFDFLLSVRDKYSLPDIEDLKPWVAEIRRGDLIRQEATDAYNAIIKEKM